jgi:glycosyltransferase involved in cell wall biosynthesis
MKDYKFSIITVCYNAEAYIEATIKSVIKQNFDNFQYIIIDGNSTDNTLGIVKKYKDDITVIISEPDNGIYDAMNKGLKLANGQFVNFLNAGDVFCSSNILNKINDYINYDTKVISGDFNLINSRTGLNKLIRTKILTIKNLKKNFSACHQSIFISKDIAENYNLSFKIRADYLWVIESVFKTQDFQVVKLDFALVDYNQEGSSFNSFWRSLKELIIIQERKFKRRFFFNSHIYIIQIIRHVKNQIFH